jgi:adenosylcobinamide kinase/adenosylcobinamide-phosphate guanylyltransferase
MNNKLPPLILVTGAANSGKSEWAEYLAIKTQQPLIYIATGQKNESDPEWMEKIEVHQKRRTSQWQTWEIPQELPSAITQIPVDSCTLIDSLGTWVANYLEAEDALWQKQTEELIFNLQNAQSSPIILVAEETGWGVVPAYELGRLFRRRLGILTRQIGTIADRVYLVVGGYAVDVSQIGIKIGLAEKAFSVNS